MSTRSGMTYHQRRRAGLTVGKTRGALYTTARVLGDVQAVRSGRVGKRVARRLVGRATSRALWALFR